MKKQVLSFLFSLLLAAANAQTSTPAFPQAAINTIGMKQQVKNAKHEAPAAMPKNNSSAYKMLEKMEEVKKTDWQSRTHKNNNNLRLPLDTIYVGLIPNDTLFITGTFNHNGPIWVFGNGVLIFYNATVENTGDIAVWQNGRVLSEGSSLTFPQTYFYQRQMIFVQHSVGYFSNTSFNYSGLQHGLVVGDSAQVGFVNVHQADWTTGGVFGAGTLWMNGVNLSGEYILTDTANTYFNNSDSLLIWHKLPETAVINYTFPPGASVMGYVFNNASPGVSGIDYSVVVDSSETVWWGLMPVNGSDVTLNNSDIRAIGCWFERGDTATVNGVFNNTTYANTVMPFTDRNIHLINTFVMTWSLYVFDSSSINLYNSTIGEVGTQQTSSVLANSFLLDGTGGYFWSTDTSTTFASEVTIYSTARSEKHSLFVLSYSDMYFSTPTSIQNSIFISSQNNLPADPVPFDASTMWMQNIEQPGTAHADSLINVTGSEWIDQGPDGGILFYQNYSLYYQLYGAGTWTPLVLDSAMEIRHNTLGVWNTTGLPGGLYILRLVVRDTYADSVEAFKAVTMLPAVPTNVGDPDKYNALLVFPNPASDQLTVLLSENNSAANIRILDVLGKVVLSRSTEQTQNVIDISGLAAGTYMVERVAGDDVKRMRFVKR
jgi:hypothetical protein